MNILGIETSTKCSSIALQTEAGLFSREGSSGHHSAALFSDCEELLRDAGIRADQLEAVSAGLGPGSFTGIRIAVTAVKGIAWSLGIPAGGVSSFQAAAAGAAVLVPEREHIQIISDARMKEYFIGTYSVRQGHVSELSLEVAEIEELPFKLIPGSCISGPAADVCRDMCDDLMILNEGGVPTAALVITETERCTGFRLVTEYDLEPLYLKKSEPERKRALGNV